MVEDVATRLKVPSRILRAIEDGGIGDLPHTVYTRGFIKGYGLILGYSNEKITSLLDSLEDFDDDFSPPKTMEAMPLGVNDGPRPGRRGLRLVIKILVPLLLAGGGYLYYTKTFRNENILPLEIPSFQNSESPATLESPVTDMPASAVVERNSADSPEESMSLPVPPAEADPTMSADGNAEAAFPATMAQPAVEASALMGNTDALAPETSPVAETAPAETAPPKEEAGQGMPEGTVVSSAASAHPPENRENAALPQPEATPMARPRGSSESASVFGTSTLPSSLPAGMQQIVVVAMSECWVHANADGTVTREFSLKAGEKFAMPFKDNLVLKLGNAGGVSIRYNGKEIPSPGAVGQVKTIRFPLP